MKIANGGGAQRAVVVGWMLISGLVIFGPLLLSRTISVLSAGGVAGLITILAGRSSLLPPNADKSAKAGPMVLILSKAVTIAAFIFIAVLMILITRAMTWMMLQIGDQLHFSWNLDAVSHVVGAKVQYLNVLLYTPISVLTSFALGLLGFGVAMAYTIDPNRFSLHAVYRDRLIRAYLGASNKQRDPNPVTGFDQNDNIRMHELWTEEKFRGRLLPIVSIALNLVGGSKLAWQQRKAESFTVSPLHCGSYELRYRKTNAPPGKRYGGQQGISLGTATTISGAAASPNMGYHSSLLVTFILTLLNVRLGAWLGNPGKAGEATFHLGYPNFSVGPIIAEAFGLTNAPIPTFISPMAGISKISACTRWCFGDATTLSSAMPAKIQNVRWPIWVRLCARLGSILESQSSSITWAFIRVRKSARSKIPGTTVRLVEFAI